MFRTASNSLTRRRFHLSPSSSSPLSPLNHQILFQTTINTTNATCTNNNWNCLVSSSNYTSGANNHNLTCNQSHLLLNTQGVIHTQPTLWRSQTNQLRLLSTNDKRKATGSEKRGETGESGGANNDNVEDNLMFGLDQKRLLIALGFVSAGSAIIALPVTTRHLHQIQQEYKEDELEIDEELYKQMKDISSEAEGEITQRLLGEELAKKLREGGRKKAVDNTVALFTDVINSEALQNAITSLLSSIVTSAQFKGACQMLLKNLWDDLIKDPETTAQVVALLNTAIKDEVIKASFKELILGLLRDEDVKQELTSLVVQLGEEQEVLDATRELLTESAHRALNDPEILDHSMEFATDVVGDNVLQRTSGEALRNTVTYAVKPSLSTFLSVFGVALLFFSASALGKARISARESREIDAAVSIVAKGIGNNFLSKLGKILSMPVHAVSGLASALITTILYPFQVIGRAANAITAAGNLALNTVIDIFVKASSFPSFVREIVSLSLYSIQISLSNFTQQSVRFIASLPGVIITKANVWLSAAGIYIQDGLRHGGSKAYSSVVSVFTVAGMKLSMLLNFLIQKSRSSLDNAGKQIVLKLTDTISRLLAILRRTNHT